MALAAEADVEVTQMAGLMPGAPQDDRLRVQFLKRPVYDKLTSEGCDALPPLQAKTWALAHPDDHRATEILAELARPGRVYSQPVGMPPAGRKHFVDAEFIRIAVPGKVQNVVEHRAKPHHIQRFAKQYAAFKAGLSQDSASGTPLDALTSLVPPILRAAQIEELKYFEVRTVEQLVAMPDSAAQHFMGMTDIKRRAQSYLDASKSEAPIAHLRVENEKLSGTVAAQERAIKEMAERLERMEKNSKRKTE